MKTINRYTLALAVLASMSLPALAGTPPTCEDKAARDLLINVLITQIPDLYRKEYAAQFAGYPQTLIDQQLSGLNQAFDALQLTVKVNNPMDYRPYDDSISARYCEADVEVAFVPNPTSAVEQDRKVDAARLFNQELSDRNWGSQHLYFQLRPSTDDPSKFILRITDQLQ